MRTFDLEAAKAGAPVCTYAGNPVRIICFDKKGTCSPIIGLIECGIVEKLNRYDGEGYDYHGIGNNNLMMRDDDYAEKLARGGYGHHIEDKLEKIDPTVKENLTVDTPTCKESLPVDRVAWRREFAEKVALTIIGGMIARAHSADKNLTLFEAVAYDAVSYADALITELEKKEKDG